MINISNETEFINYLLDKTSNNYNLKSDYKLLNNIDFSLIPDNLKKSIGIYSGVLDGNGKSINNFNLLSPSKGLFSEIRNGKIKDLTININLDQEIKMKDLDSGLFVGYLNSSELINIKINGKIFIYGPNTDNIGILVGSANNSSISESRINLDHGLLVGNFKVGGFIGKAKDTILRNCIITGKINIIGELLVGGLIGDVDNCILETLDLTFKGTIQSHFKGGGIIGNVSNSNLSNIKFHLKGDLVGKEDIGILYYKKNNILTYNITIGRNIIFKKKLIDAINILDYNLEFTQDLTNLDKTLDIVNRFKYENSILFQNLSYYYDTSDLFINNYKIENISNTKIKVYLTFNKELLSLENDNERALKNNLFNYINKIFDDIIIDISYTPLKITIELIGQTSSIIDKDLVKEDKVIRSYLYLDVDSLEVSLVNLEIYQGIFNLKDDPEIKNLLNDVLTISQINNLSYKYIEVNFVDKVIIINVDLDTSNLPYLTNNIIDSLKLKIIDYMKSMITFEYTNIDISLDNQLFISLNLTLNETIESKPKSYYRDASTQTGEIIEKTTKVNNPRLLLVRQPKFYDRFKGKGNGPAGSGSGNAGAACSGGGC